MIPPQSMSLSLSLSHFAHCFSQIFWVRVCLIFAELSLLLNLFAWMLKHNWIQHDTLCRFWRTNECALTVRILYCLILYERKKTNPTTTSYLTEWQIVSEWVSVCACAHSVMCLVWAFKFSNHDRSMSRSGCGSGSEMKPIPCHLVLAGCMGASFLHRHPPLLPLPVLVFCRRCSHFFSHTRRFCFWLCGSCHTIYVSVYALFARKKIV